MLLANKTFYNPSKAARYLAILDTLSQNSRVSQTELGRRANLSGAMVNQYLKEMVDKNLIEYERVNGKSFRYLLTDQGEAKRQSMFSSFSSETVQIYTALKTSDHAQAQRPALQRHRQAGPVRRLGDLRGRAPGPAIAWGPST